MPDLVRDPRDRYVIRSADGPDGIVELWMIKRLGFDTKKDWEKQLVRDLKRELTKLEWSPQVALSGLFASDDPQRCDAENLLYYNPGSATFNGLPHRLKFERLRIAPEPPVPLAGTNSYRYYHAYRASSDEERFAQWEAAECLARFDGVSIGAISGDQAGRLVWWWLRSEEQRIQLLTDRTHATDFGLHVVVHVPRGRAVKLAGVVKGLVDGVVGALHQGTRPADAARAAVLLWPKLKSIVPSEGALAQALASDRTVLFTDPAFKVHPTWVQLDPADHLCAAGLIELREGSVEGGRRLSAELFSLRPVRGVNDA